MRPPIIRHPAPPHKVYFVEKGLWKPFYFFERYGNRLPYAFTIPSIVFLCQYALLLSKISEILVIGPCQNTRLCGNILAIIQLAIIAFASIAIVVGGIGITNTMFSSVRERTREIGIMKAIGAKNRDILTIFLFESGILGLVGGVVGVAVGIGIGQLVQAIAATANLGSFKVYMSPELVIGALLFSFVVGCMSGIAPARQAARLRPVDALRG